LPAGEWVQAQSWEDLLFAHWRMPEEALRDRVPSELSLDTFEGSAWLAVTPFRLTGLRLRGLLPLPRLSSFLEINVRTYVTFDDRPGIFFFSLDAASMFAAEAARLLYKLPYFRARMSAQAEGEWVEYASARADPRGHGADFRARYRPAGKPQPPEPGSLEHFLVERYCLYTLHERVVHRAEIHHPLWPLQPAEAEIEQNTMPPPGLEVKGKPFVHFSGRQDVLIWGLEPA
jgi:uncharacterized protein